MSWTDRGIESYRKRGGLLIGLNGVARSGKDTVGKMLIENYGFERLAFADALRKGLYDLNPIVTFEIVKENVGFWQFLKTGVISKISVREIRLQEIIDELGWEEAKVQYPEIRELMQRYGTEAGRNVHGDTCWTSILKRIIESNTGKNYVITDMRFDNEAKIVSQLGGCRVQIQRPGVTSVNNHVSDAVLPEHLFDFILQNDGTLEELKVKVDELMNEVSPFRDVAGTTSFGKF